MNRFTGNSMTRLAALAAVVSLSAGNIWAQATTPTSADPVSQTTATPATTAPMTKDEMKSQKKAQKQQEKAANANAKAAKSQAKAKKDQDKALQEQEKTAGTAPKS